MALSVFDDPEARPTDRGLARALGKTGPVWSGLKSDLLRDHAPLEEEWGFAGAKFGWSLRLKRGKRVIVYLTPGAGQFLASFALGEKACAAAREARLPARIWTVIEEAPKYAEGRGVRITVRNKSDAGAIVKLAGIKLAN